MSKWHLQPCQLKTPAEREKPALAPGTTTKPFALRSLRGSNDDSPVWYSLCDGRKQRLRKPGPSKEEVIAMLTTELLKKMQEAKAVETYLGYTVQEIAGWYLAVPQGWRGDVLEAATLPEMRRKIWRWWYQVPV